MANQISRRSFLRSAGVTVAGAILVVCAAPTGSAPAVDGGGEVDKDAVSIEFWSQNYGDPELYLQFMQDKAATFREESDIEVDVQLINWSNAMNTWLLVTQGGAHPDGADMYWLYSFSTLGGDQNGPMPITDYQETYWPDLEERFFAGGLQDVMWQGEFYGIPWRGDIRPMLYRVDMLEEAGFSGPPQTWDELTEVAAATTVRDGGNTSVWGFEFGSAMPIQQYMPYLWQAGGEYMTEDGKTATVDTDEMRAGLEWAKGMLWTEEVTPTDNMEKGHAPYDMFTAGQIAVIGEVPDDVGNNLDRDFPEMDGQWAFSVPAQGPVNRASYSGAGYWGAMRGSEKVPETVEWIAYMSRDENMQEITEFLGRVSPNKNVMASDFWADRPWKQVIVECLDHAHTSQHPSPAWAKLTAGEPGSVLYDLYYEALIQQQPVDDVLARAQQRMQEEMDKIEV